MSDDHITAADGPPVAAEYVLHLLDADERAAVERRMTHDPQLAQDVAFWETRLVTLADSIRPVEPPVTVWHRIEHEVRVPASTQGRGLWHSIGFWRWSAAGSAALALASLAGLVAFVGRSPPPPLVATLDASGRAGFVAAIDAGHNTMTIVPAALTNADQKSLQLWLIAPGDQPRSLGLVDPKRPLRVAVPADLIGRVGENAVLAISVEPVGGSPTGLPTGPVVANGKLTRL